MDKANEEARSVDWRDLVLLADTCKELHISKCGQFISGLFPWKKTGLGRVGGERESFKIKHDEKNKRGWRPGWQAPEQPVARGPVAREPRAP